MKRKFIVEVEMPKLVPLYSMREYIEDAVKSLKGTLRPDNPIFNLDRQSVTVKIVLRRKKKKVPKKGKEPCL